MNANSVRVLEDEKKRVSIHISKNNLVPIKVKTK